MDLALTARVVGAEEARRLGLVSAVVDTAAAPAAGTGAGAGAEAGRPGGGGGGGGVAASPRAALLSAALRLADTVAAKPQLAAQGTKRVLLHARWVHGRKGGRWVRCGGGLWKRSAQSKRLHILPSVLYMHPPHAPK